MRKDSFWKVITFVFVFVDIFLIIGLMRILKDYQKTSSMFQERQGRIEEVLNDITDVDNDLIHGLLDDEGLSLNFDPQMFMVIPASPCSACLDRESLLFEKFAKTGLVKCQILVPDYRLKDTRALFSRDLNLSINAYSLETLTNDYWRYSEKIIYFLSRGADISNIMITSKYSDISTEYYFEHLSKKLGDYTLNP